MKSQTPLYSMLSLERLRLDVKIGWAKAERLTSQPLDLDIYIKFGRPPEACYSDKLPETICYGDLAGSIQSFCDHKQFRLIENIASEIYTELKSKLTKDATLLVRIKKLHPPVAGLNGGASFSYGDFEQ